MHKLNIKQNKNISEKDIWYLAEIGKISCGLLHDLINPITGLILYLDIIKQNKSLDLESFLGPIEKSSANIKNFIHKINELIASPEQINIINLEKEILNSIEMFRPKILRNQVNVNFIRNENKFLIMGNNFKLSQIFMNLISNALDSFEEITDDRKRKIWIELIKDKNEILIKIRDNGIGMENLDLKSKSSKIHGFGFGLQNTFDICEKDFESKINFKSKIDKGTEFEIVINPKRIIG